MTEATQKKKMWTPNWEVSSRYDKFHPPPSARPWAFKPKSGKIVNLDADYNIRPNTMDGQRPQSWSRINGTTKNPHRWIELTWEQVQKAAVICRERQWPLKKGVAAVIDRDQYIKSQLAELAAAPEVYLTGQAPVDSIVKTEAVYDKATEAFFADVAKETAPAAPKAATPKAG